MLSSIKALLKLLGCGLLATIAGCQAIAAVLDKASPDPTEPAMYAPTKDNMLVLVESYQNPASVEVIAEHIDRLIAEQFIAYKVAPVINPDRLSNLRTANPAAYKRMKIPAVGREVNASQVLYVNIGSFTIESAAGTDALQGHADAHVKIVDVVSGLTRWPRDATSDGMAVAFDLPFAADAQITSEPKVREALAQGLAEKVAKLFYEHTVGQSRDAPSYPETEMP